MNSRCLSMHLNSWPAFNSWPVKAEGVKYDDGRLTLCVSVYGYGNTPHVHSGI